MSLHSAICYDSLRAEILKNALKKCEGIFLTLY